MGVLFEETNEVDDNFTEDCARLFLGWKDLGHIKFTGSHDFVV